LTADDVRSRCVPWLLTLPLPDELLRFCVRCCVLGSCRLCFFFGASVADDAVPEGERAFAAALVYGCLRSVCCHTGPVLLGVVPLRSASLRVLRLKPLRKRAWSPMIFLLWLFSSSPQRWRWCHRAESVTYKCNTSLNITHQPLQARSWTFALSEGALRFIWHTRS
jgi:hypothetical protein